MNLSASRSAAAFGVLLGLLLGLALLAPPAQARGASDVKARQLSLYFAHTKAPMEDYWAASRLLMRIFEPPPYDPSALTPKLKKLPPRFGRVATAMAAVRAPLFLRAVHAKMVRSLRINAVTIKAYVAAWEKYAQSGDRQILLDAFERYEPEANRSNQLQGVWLKELVRQARQTGVTMPRWLRSLLPKT